MDESNKIILILGASSEIGTGLIKKIHSRYDFLIAHYNSTSDDLKKLKMDLGEKLILLQADFSSMRSTKKFIDALAEIDMIPSEVLHLPAEKGSIKRFSRMSWGDFEKRIQISLRSIVLVLNYLLPKMAKKGVGKVIMMLTIHTCQEPLKGCSDYVTEKYALLGLIKSLAVEYSHTGITINGISPGAIDTKFNRDLPEIVLQQYAASSEFGENLSVEKLIPDIEYLLSEKSDSISGENFLVDGTGIGKS